MNRKFRLLLPVICFVLIVSFSPSTAQNTLLCDSVYPTVAGSILVSAIQLNSCLDEIADIDSAKKLVQILNVDAVKYFDLTRVYDMESKLNDYKQTKAYKDQVAQLTALKKEALGEYYYSVLTNNLGKFSWSFKGFKFDMDKLSTPGGVTGAPPPPSTMFYAIDLRKLPFEISGKSDQDIVLSVDPESGMNIDRNKDSIMVLVFYKLGEVAPKEYSYYNEQCHCNRNAKEDVIQTKNNRVMIFNVKSNEIYIDKAY